MPWWAEWDAEQIRFYVDDEHFWTLRDNDVDRFLANQTAPMQIIFNVAVGGSFLDQAQPDKTSVWPQRLLVDYVRVFDRTSRLNRQQPSTQPE